MMLPCQEKINVMEEKSRNSQLSPLLGMERALFEEHKESLSSEYVSRVQNLVDQWEGTSPEVATLLRKRIQRIRLITMFGSITIRVRKGIDRKNRQWVSPALIFLGIRPYQRYSPDIEKRLAILAVETGSYEKAATVAEATWFTTSDDAVRSLVLRLAQAAKEPPAIELLPGAAGREDTLIVMADGWNARHRGKNWGRSPKNRQLSERVHWHEIRSGVIFKLSSLLAVSGKRKAIMDKHIVAVPAETSPYDFGVLLEREAMRMGLVRAKSVFFVMDGGVWLWNIFKDRFEKCSKAMLDIYHLSQHLHILGAALHGEDSSKTAQWCGKIMRDLKHKSPKSFFKKLDRLLQEPPSDDPDVLEVIREQNNYFRNHIDHMDYATNAALGAPIGSGSMESLCSQLQCRLKRTGQFWSKIGFASLLKVTVRYRNREFDPLWRALAT
jgi:hypothetical protein